MVINSNSFNYYPLFITLSLIIGIIFIDIMLLKWNIKKVHVLSLNIILFFLIPLGGILLTIIEHLIINKKFAIGFSSYGGVFGAIIAFYIFCKIFKYNYKHLYKIMFLSMPLFYSISKLGCFLAGCCYGIKYNGFFSIKYISSHGAPVNTPLFPIQLVESIAFIIIFILLLLINKRTNKNIISLSLIICGITKYLLEFLRQSWEPFISFTQLISLIMVLIGLILLNKELKNNGGKKKSY